MKNHSLALMIYGETGSERNALTEEKYYKLADFLIKKGFNVDSVLYNDSISDKLAEELTHYNAILVWVNPVERGGDRKILDSLLNNLAAQGCFVSAHPDTILKMGNKDILFQTKDTAFGSDVKLYGSYKEFQEKFPDSLQSGARIIKHLRGNGGNGVFKIQVDDIKNSRIGITHAKKGDELSWMNIDEFFGLFDPYFKTGGSLIDQPWNENIINGMVRCYLVGTKVAGFGYQEINALYPISGTPPIYKKPSQRFYFSEDCGLFKDLKDVMENSWVKVLQKITGTKDEMLPVIWDADFFINKVNSEPEAQKYSLCEINVSSVSPFPESSIPYIAEEVMKRIS